MNNLIFKESFDWVRDLLMMKNQPNMAKNSTKEF